MSPQKYSSSNSRILKKKKKEKKTIFAKLNRAKQSKRVKILKLSGAMTSNGMKKANRADTAFLNTSLAS